MSKKNYELIEGLVSETEPKEYRLYGKNGVDHFTNVVQLEDGTWRYDILRFERKADYVLYRQING